MDTRDNFTRTSLRIPQDLYDRLTEAAAGKNSLNAEIIRRLEASFEAKDGTSYAASEVNKIVDATIRALERNGWQPPSSD